MAGITFATRPLSFGSDLQCRYVDRRVVSFNHHDVAFGNEIAFSIFVEIVANPRIRRNFDVLVENGAAHFRVPSDVAIVEDDRIFNLSACVDPDPATEHRRLNESSGHNRTSGNNRVHGHTSAAFLIKYKFRGSIEVSGGSQRPLAVVEVEFRRD